MTQKKMKLAHALQERADINIKIEQLKTRLLNNALVQEGEKSSENPIELLKELDNSIKRLEYLISRINITNASTYTSNGKSITELIALKDTISLKISVYREFLNSASSTTSRYARSEIKIISNINVKKFQKNLDLLSKELRNIDNSIQELNWNVELV